MIELATAVTNAFGAALQLGAGGVALSLAYYQWRRWRSRNETTAPEPIETIEDE